MTRTSSTLSRNYASVLRLHHLNSTTPSTLLGTSLPRRAQSGSAPDLGGVPGRSSLAGASTPRGGGRGEGPGHKCRGPRWGGREGRGAERAPFGSPTHAGLGGAGGGGGPSPPRKIPGGIYPPSHAGDGGRFRGPPSRVGSPHLCAGSLGGGVQPPVAKEGRFRRTPSPEREPRALEGPPGLGSKGRGKEPLCEKALPTRSLVGGVVSGGFLGARSPRSAPKASRGPGSGSGRLRD